MRALSLRACLVICLVLTVSLAACGGDSKPAAGGDTGANTQATAAPAQAAATKAPAAATAAPVARATEAPAAATPVPTEETLSIRSRAEGLDKLESYRARWVSEWSGLEDDKQVTVTWDWTEEYTRNPEMLHFIFTSTSSEDPSEQGAMEMWQIGDTTYMMMGEMGGEQQCITIAREEQDRLERGLFNPSSLGSLNDARYVGMEDVNGIRARHYRYDEKAASLTGFSKVAGEIWVAVDGGYVVRDTLTWEGSAGFLGTASSGVDQGQGQWTWELSDVNQAITIAPPENCASAAGDLPLLPDATEKTTFGDMVSYKTGATVTEAMEFYQEQMPAAGWVIEGDPMVMDAFAQLSYTKDGQTAQVMITSDDDKTQVLISIQK